MILKMVLERDIDCCGTVNCATLLWNSTVNKEWRNVSMRTTLDHLDGFQTSVFPYFSDARLLDFFWPNHRSRNFCGIFLNDPQTFVEVKLKHNIHQYKHHSGRFEVICPFRSVSI